jgi:hypothetical protein
MSTSLRGALSIERSRLFVGRKREIGYMQKWLGTQTAPTEILYVSGMGGIGKSALLLQFLNLAQADGDILCVWLDGRTCSGPPGNFLDALHAYLFPGSRLNAEKQSPLLTVTQLIAKQRTVICIDNYESLQLIEGWLREVFLPELPATNLLLVLAARSQLSLDWENDWAWRGRLRHLRLTPVSRAEARMFYNRLGLGDNPAVGTLIRDTHGHPLAMALTADRLQQSSQTNWDWSVDSLVSASLLREVTKPEFHEALDVLCIVPQANLEFLNRVLVTPMTVNQLYQLTQLSFIRPNANGISLHDVARAHLLQDFVRREPSRYETLRLRIVEETCRELQAVDHHGKRQFAASLMSICRDAMSFHSRVGFATNPETADFSSFHPSDLPHLHRLVKEEQVQKATTLTSNEQAHALLDALATNFPEGIRLFRSEDATPAVFHAGLMLYRDTCVFLDTYLPTFLEACFSDEAQKLRALSPEEAGTYLHLLGGGDGHHPDYTRHELLGFMTTDGLARTIGTGIRLILTTNNADVKTVYGSLGFKNRPLLDVLPIHPFCEDNLYELDLHDGNFGDWVLSYLKGRATQHPNQEVDITVDDLKAALPIYMDEIALEHTAIAQRMRFSGQRLNVMLQQLLNGDPPPPMTKEQQAMLRLFSVEPMLSANFAAAKLHISRSSYYRHLRIAFNNMIQLLTRR